MFYIDNWWSSTSDCLSKLRSIEWDATRVVFDIDFRWFNVKSDWLLLTELEDEGDRLSSEEK